MRCPGPTGTKENVDGKSGTSSSVLAGVGALVKERHDDGNGRNDWTMLLLISI
jgi:hypothetical protein